VHGKYGQFNSPSNDTRFTVMQAISFPKVYRRQQEVFREQTRGSTLIEKVIKLTVKKQVVRVYYDMLIMLLKKQLLQRADSLYQAVQQKQELGFKAGEVNIVEVTSARSQRQQAAVQLQQLETDFQMLQSHLSYLLNTKEALVPLVIDPRLELLSTPDTAALTQYPVLQVKKQQQDYLWKELLLAKSRKLPLLNLGYSNQSLIGPQNINGVNKYFDASRRFSSVIAGINIPIFTGYLRARINAADVKYIASQSEYADTLAYQESLLQQLLLTYRKNQQTLKYFEVSALQQSRILFENASLQFNNGAINFFEWTVLVNQSIGLQSDYINALNDWNRTVLEINSYSPNF
jgi:cobalt-zinc-cadmium resistance protein CzcA